MIKCYGEYLINIPGIIFCLEEILGYLFVPATVSVKNITLPLNSGGFCEEDGHVIFKSPAYYRVIVIIL